MKVISVLGAFLILASCSSFERSQESAVQSPELRDFQTLEKHVKTQNLEAALSTADSFQASYPYSLKLQKVRFLKARIFEEQGRWTEAAAAYKTIAAISLKNQPEISAMAMYRLSFVYEALGDDQRVLTTLFEAQRYQKYLPIEVMNAEIPSRLAMVYAKENNPEEAQKWLSAADKGLKKTLETSQEALSNEWLAELYFNMGSISTQQLSGDNILTIIQGQAAIQKYLIRTLQYEDPLWSVKSLKKLKDTYLDLWKTIEGAPQPSGYEPLVAQKLRKEQQLSWAKPFSELIQEAELYRPAEEQKLNLYQKEFFNFLEELQTRLHSVLADSFYTPLILHKDKAPQKPKSPVKIVPSEDPNL